MAEICCQYCNGRNILKIVYCYRGVNKRKQNYFDYSDYLEGGYPDIDMEDTYLFRSSTIIYSSYISINLIFIRSYRN